MSGFPGYDEYDALGLAELVRRGEVSAAELLEEAIARYEAVNPAINAVVGTMLEEARRDAATAPVEGPFAGVPTLLKDLLHSYAGHPLTSGSAALLDYVPEQDSELVIRLRRAGLIPFGKTNIPEFGLLATTEPALFGATRNPWDLGRTSGGSSGGSGAAVAAGIVPIASATDGGGSIRIPAAWCGLFGMKVTRGRVPVGPEYGEVWSGAVVHGVLTRSVRDSAAALDALCGAAPGDSYVAPVPPRPFLSEVGEPPDRLRIAFSDASPIGSDVDAECRRVVHDAARLLESLGHTVQEAAPPIEGMAVARCYFTLAAAHAAADMRLIAQHFGRSALRRIEPITRIAGLIGESLPAAAFVADRYRWNDFARAMAAFHERFDLYLTPTTGTAPIRLGSLQPSAVEAVGMRIVDAVRGGGLLRATGLHERIGLEQMAPAPFTQLANLTGQPAMSVPLHWGADGLPYGVQFVAPLGDEATLFRLAAQLEEARPWAHRRPSVYGRQPTLPLAVQSA